MCTLLVLSKKKKHCVGVLLGWLCLVSSPEEQATAKIERKNRDFFINTDKNSFDWHKVNEFLAFVLRGHLRVLVHYLAYSIKCIFEMHQLERFQCDGDQIETDSAGPIVLIEIMVCGFQQEALLCEIDLFFRQAMCIVFP